MDSTNNPYACGDDPTNKNLQDRLHQMRLELKILRKKLSLEKSLLRRQKGELYGEDAVQTMENAEINWMNASKPRRTESQLTISLNKSYLKDIETKCEKELDKLKEYISSVNKLRDTWIKVREADSYNSGINRGSKKIMPKPSYIHIPKQYARGKVFYVDSTLC